MFEKFDGIRMLWDSQERQFYSRWGKILRLPPYFADMLPAYWLDGEVSYSYLLLDCVKYDLIVVIYGLDEKEENAMMLLESVVYLYFTSLSFS